MLSLTSFVFEILFEFCFEFTGNYELWTTHMSSTHEQHVQEVNTTKQSRKRAHLVKGSGSVKKAELSINCVKHCGGQTDHYTYLLVQIGFGHGDSLLSYNINLKNPRP